MKSSLFWSSSIFLIWKNKWALPGKLFFQKRLLQNKTGALEAEGWLWTRPNIEWLGKDRLRVSPVLLPLHPISFIVLPRWDLCRRRVLPWNCKRREKKRKVRACLDHENFLFRVQMHLDCVYALPTGWIVLSLFNCAATEKKISSKRPSALFSDRAESSAVTRRTTNDGIIHIRWDFTDTSRYLVRQRQSTSTNPSTKPFLVTLRWSSS